MLYVARALSAAWVEARKTCQESFSLLALLTGAEVHRAPPGLAGIHFHDLRHAGKTLTADEGASLRELINRMGHSSTLAALIYLHSSDERQRKLAYAVGEAARAVLGKDRDSIWHGGGTKPRSDAMKPGAPGRIRTRDPLLRRQLLCPAELRALET